MILSLVFRPLSYSLEKKEDFYQTTPFSVISGFYRFWFPGEHQLIDINVCLKIQSSVYLTSACSHLVFCLFNSLGYGVEGANFPPISQLKLDLH